MMCRTTPWLGAGQHGRTDDTCLRSLPATEGPTGTRARGGAMSAQGTTLNRRGMHLPIWPVAALLVIAVGATIALRVIDDLRRAEPVVTTQETFAFDPKVIEGSGAAIRELPAGPFHAAGRAHEVVPAVQENPIMFVTGLENPGVYVLPGDLAGPPELPSF